MYQSYTCQPFSLNVSPLKPTIHKFIEILFVKVLYVLHSFSFSVKFLVPRKVRISVGRY